MSKYPDYPAFNADLPVNLGSISIEHDGTITVNGVPATVKDLKAARNILDIALTIHWCLSVKDEAENRNHVRKDNRREYDQKVEKCTNYVLQHGSIPMSDLVRYDVLDQEWSDLLESIVEDMVSTGKVEKIKIRSNRYRLEAKTGPFAPANAEDPESMNTAARREYDHKVEECINYVLARGSISIPNLKRYGPAQRKWRVYFESIVDDMVATGKVEKQETKARQFRLVATHQSTAGNFPPITAQDVQAAMDDAEQSREARPPRFENREEANEFHKQKLQAIVRALASQ